MIDVSALIFAYQSHNGMQVLMQPRTAASVPFGGRFRAIDFPLSNLVNAGVSSVGVVLRDTYQSLMDHLGSGRDWDLARNKGGLYLLPPFSYSVEPHRETRFFSGKMEALNGVATFIANNPHEYIVLCDGDCVANIRLAPVLDGHVASGADVTALYVSEPVGDPARSVYFDLDDTGRVTDVLVSATPRPNESLGVFILKQELLLKMMETAQASNIALFERGILRSMLKDLNVRAVRHDGYTARMHTVKGYYRHSMDLLREDVRASLFDPGNPVRTRLPNCAPVYYEEGSKVSASLIGNGCRIEGTVENSILFRNVRVARGAVVRNSIIMQNCTIGEDVRLDCVIADKNVTVSRGKQLCGVPESPVVLSKGSVL